MIRSNFAITRLIVLPYGVLLVLYLLVVGGGGAWLYLQVRAVETRLLVDDVMATIEPLVEKLGAVDAVAVMRGSEPWLVADVEDLFADIPSLRNMSVRGADAGYQMDGHTDGGISSRVISPLPSDAPEVRAAAPAEQRLHAESDALFLISFDLARAPDTLVRLDFAFDRGMMLAHVNQRMTTINQAVLVFGAAGGMSILLALIITMFAMRTTRKVEGHFQELYQRASLTETAAGLVHDLRNPLAALRTNVKALLVSPEQTREIVAELDHDIVTLNGKLGAFLDLTRRQEDDREPVELRELVADAVRVAKPVLARHGLSIDTDIPPDLPRPELQKTAMRDALVNLIVNAAQSGQKEGSIGIRARLRDRALEIMVEDNGTGIPAKHLPHVFDAFYTTRADGNGLGLAIVQRIIAAHQGRVWVESHPQGGTQMILTLPLQQLETPLWWNKLKKSFPA